LSSPAIFSVRRTDTRICSSNRRHVRSSLATLLIANLFDIPSHDSRLGESADGIAPAAARRTVHDTLASHSSHQVNTPIIPSRQCTKRAAFSRASLSKKRPARTL
jgi:hypothetical protein